ncbi:MAG: recombinase family protein [Acidobacteriota bacterium]
MKIAIYARVSTTDQSCGMQLHELRHYVANRGWQVHEEYVDTGFSGARASRPQIDRLLLDARQRRFDAVLVWKLDRWGRSVAHCVRSIQELVSLEIRFLSASEGIDTSNDNPMSKFMLHLFAAFAEMEREVIRERVRAGQRAAKARGQRVGRPRRVFRRDEALRLRAGGESWRSVAKTLGVPMSTVIDGCRSESPAN